MRAITITDDHQLRLEELAEPVAGPGEVLIDVLTAGVNPADLAQAAGHYPPPPGASQLPGLEVSGHRRDTGEPVVALLSGGGYAEVVAVPEAQLLPAPPALRLADAGGLVEVAATVVSNLVIEGGLPLPGETTARQTVLIHGGSGGVGSFAIQFAAALGARVLTTVGSDEAVAETLRLGAERAWNRHTNDIWQEAADEGGADLILDVIGGPALGDNVALLREFGRLIVVSTITGRKGELDLGVLMRKRARVIGTTLRSRSPEDKQRILERTQELVWPLLARGEILLPIHARIPLAEAARAHEVLRRGGHFGKVLLEVGTEPPAPASR